MWVGEAVSKHQRGKRVILQKAQSQFFQQREANVDPKRGISKFHSFVTCYSTAARR